MSRLPRSLRGRLLVLVSGLVVIVWLVAGTVTWFDARQEVDELLDGHLAQVAALLLTQEIQEASEGEEESDVTVLRNDASPSLIQVFLRGRLELRTENAPTAPMIGRVDQSHGGFQTLGLDGVPWRMFATEDAGRQIQVFVGERLSARTSVVWGVLKASLWPMLLALPLLAFSVWWAVKRGVEPLNRLGSALAARQATALRPIEVEDAPSEMTGLIDALNGLFQRIQVLVESERRFTADAAHELRTPIAATRAQAQVALAEADPVLRKRALDATVAGCDRASHLVDQMLTLARLEAAGGEDLQPIDLTSVVRRVCAELAPLAIEKHQEMELLAEAVCQVDGEASLLAVLVRNLVDNAIRYSPRHAILTIWVQPSASGATLVVEDSGPGLSEADSAKLGERFYRVLGSGETGSGLGWSIVRRIAAAHQVKLVVDRSKGLGGLRVTARFPAPQVDATWIDPVAASASRRPEQLA